AEVGDLADGGGDRVVDLQQVVVGVERELGREEWPLVRGRGPGQLLGESPSGGEGGRAERERAEERAAAGSAGRRVHAILPRVRQFDSWISRLRPRRRDGPSSVGF